MSFLRSNRRKQNLERLPEGTAALHFRAETVWLADLSKERPKSSYDDIRDMILEDPGLLAPLVVCWMFSVIVCLIIIVDKLFGVLQNEQYQYDLTVIFHDNLKVNRLYDRYGVMLVGIEVTDNDSIDMDRAYQKAEEVMNH